MKSNHCCGRWVAPALLLSMFLFSGCDAPAPKVEDAVVQPAPSGTNSAPLVTTSDTKSAPPKADEVKEAVARVFKDAVNAGDRTPTFVAGDFNGDESVDLAVLLRPAPGKLPELNQQYPPWILKNVFLIDRPGAPPQRVAENEILLAVIHGYGPKGWRDPDARQTFLLKSAAGSDMQTEERADFLKANEGKNVPRLRGDVIREVLKGKPGWLYYADATYRWYDPATFKPEPERRVVHPGLSAQAAR